MWPILAVGVAAVLVAIYKWIVLSLVKRPSRRQVKTLLESVREKDFAAAQAVGKEMKGPIGEMLAAGAANLEESSELLEEVLFERILAAKLRIQSLLPFLAVSASSAPLLGLLGTVTGIIQTFKQITIYGSGDVKSLSGGISEALITTEYGLIVAIPSLLLHSLLSRKARGLVSEMETLAVQFTNAAGLGGGVGGASSGGSSAAAPYEPSDVREQVRAVIGEILGPVLDGEDGGAKPRVS
jgi:biopolymer transport protein ExbB